MKVLGRTYRDKIILQRPDDTPDGQGGRAKKPFITVATVGANFSREPRVSTEEIAGAIVSVMIREVKILNHAAAPNVTKGWQFIHNEKPFPIDHVYDDDYDNTKVLVCREVIK